MIPNGVGLESGMRTFAGGATWSLFRIPEVAFSAYVAETKAVAAPPHRVTRHFDAEWRHILLNKHIVRVLVAWGIIEISSYKRFYEYYSCIKLSVPRGLQRYVDRPFLECRQTHGLPCHVNYKCIIYWMPMPTGNGENLKFYELWTVQDCQNGLFAKSLPRLLWA